MGKTSHWGNTGGGADLVAHLGKGVFGDVSTLLSIVQSGLQLTVLSEVRGGDLFSFVSLSLEDLQFGLEFINQLSEFLGIPLVLVKLEFAFLNTTLGLSGSLLSLLVTSLLSIQILLE